MPITLAVFCNQYPFHTGTDRRRYVDRNWQRSSPRCAIATEPEKLPMQVLWEKFGNDVVKKAINSIKVTKEA